MKTIEQLMEWLGDIKISALVREGETYSDALDYYNAIIKILKKEQEND